MEENVTIMTVLQELRDFRNENNKRWEENDRRWEQNERRWEANDRRWEANDKRLEGIEENVSNLEAKVSKLEEKTDRIEENVLMLDIKTDRIDERLTSLEEAREKDKKDLVKILDTMQTSIDKQFIQMREYMDIQFRKINAIHIANDIEHEQFREFIKSYGIKIDLQSSRITYLEKWKAQFDDDGLVGAY